MKSGEEKHEQTHDPDGVPTGNRQMKQNDQVTPTSPGLEVTSPNALSGKPSGYLVGSEAPGHSTAPAIATEATKAARSNAIPEYRPSVTSRLPDAISAREIYLDDTNPNGSGSGGRQR